MGDLAPDLVLDAHSVLGEGPVWDDADRSLLWVDILQREVHRFNPESQEDSVVLVTPTEVGAVAPRQSGGMVLALADGFWVVDSDHDRPRVLQRMIGLTPGTRFNDGRCDPSGRFWAGTIVERPGDGALYRLESGGKTKPVLSGVTISNGVGWSPDSATMYYVDTTKMTLDAFDYEMGRGTITQRRTLVTFESPRSGLPDGLAVDLDGGIWVALYGGSAVRRYLPSGRLDAIVEFPVANVTSCAFGGLEHGDLYVTTATDAKGDATQPGEGGLFRVRSNVSGMPVSAFRG